MPHSVFHLASSKSILLVGNCSRLQLQPLYKKKSNTLCSFLFTIAPVLVINSIKIWEVFYDEFVPHSPRKYIPRSDKDFLDGTFMC